MGDTIGLAWCIFTPFLIFPSFLSYDPFLDCIICAIWPCIGIIRVVIPGDFERVCVRTHSPGNLAVTRLSSDANL